MVTLQGLYEYADKKNIALIYGRTHNKKAFAIEEASGGRAVVIDATKVESNREEKVVLSEELGHLDRDALCFVHDYASPLYAQNIRKAERRALAWAYQQLLPFRELKAAIIREKDLYQVADFFDVPFYFLEQAILYYRTKGKEVL